MTTGGNLIYNIIRVNSVHRKIDIRGELHQTSHRRRECHNAMYGQGRRTWSSRLALRPLWNGGTVHRLQRPLCYRTIQR